MSVSLAFGFVSGRYHATPFGHHVNEGLIEWPPSPWRLLRALISVGYTSGAWNGDGLPGAARSLFEKLSSELPSYHLPAAIGAHSRHYMPTGVLNDKKVEKTTLVFDTWARVENKDLIVTWPNIRLNESERNILSLLATRLNYLGRSESWVEGRLVEDWESLPKPNCLPDQEEKKPGRGWEQVALLASESASEFAAWRTTQVEAALADLQAPTGRKPSKSLLSKRNKAVEPYPADILDCLQKDTNWLRSHGWSQPPGSRRVFYWRPVDAVSVGAPMAKVSARPMQRVEAVLLSLTNASRNDHALPPVTRTFPQAELLHRALVSIAAKRGAPPPELTGRDEFREPLRGPHEHAHIFPLDLDGDGHLEHILIWAPMGLGELAQGAIRGIRRTFTEGGMEPLRLAIAADGSWEDLIRLPGKYGQRIARLQSDRKVWESITPFVAPRHLKKNGKNTLEGQIRAELDSRGFPQPSSMGRLMPLHRNRKAFSSQYGRALAEDATSQYRFRHFKLVRKHGPEPPITCGFAIRLEFPYPVSGPIALGYGSHFGLGLFVGVNDIKS